MSQIPIVPSSALLHTVLSTVIMQLIPALCAKIWLVGSYDTGLTHAMAVLQATQIKLDVSTMALTLESLEMPYDGG